jgi:hypothetical protein
VSIDGKLYRSSNLVWYLHTGEWPPFIIDHKDRNKLNERFSNLRLSTHSANAANVAIKAGVSGIIGVYPNRNRWRAQIAHKHLGTFNTVEEAKAARHKAAIELWGFDPNDD